MEAKSTPGDRPPIPADLLELLACPVCDSHPRLALAGECLRCPECRRQYPVEDGIPNLLPEAGRVAPE